MNCHPEAERLLAKPKDLLLICTALYDEFSLHLPLDIPERRGKLPRPRGRGLMSVEENVALMRRWFHEVWNEGRLETVTELLAEDAIGMGQGTQGTITRGPRDFIPFVKRIRGAFPDIRIRVEDAFGAGDKVAVRWSADMTHQGAHLGVPPTGRRVRITGISVVRIAKGKLAEGWDNWDQLAMMQQIGALQEVHPASEMLGADLQRAAKT
jgi:steroid delta-isomerase-like uncharacterized protein